MTGHPPTRSTGLLKLHRVTQRATRADVPPLIDSLSLSVTPGEVLGLLGPAGGAPASLLRLMAALDRPAAGEITLDGRPLQGTPAERGHVSSAHRLVPWLSLRDNVALGLLASPWSAEQQAEAVREVLAEAGLTGVADELPHEVSPIDVQRTVLARALVSRPPLLLLDDPLAPLDPASRADLLALLPGWLSRAGVTTVLATPRPDDALLLCDRIMLMAGRSVDPAASLSVPQPRPRALGDPALVVPRRLLAARLERATRASAASALAPLAAALAPAEDVAMPALPGVRPLLVAPALPGHSGAHWRFAW